MTADVLPAAASADADPDEDGVPNSAEYILGGNPVMPATADSPVALTSGGNTLFTFRRSDESKTPDVTLTVESGADLVTWPDVFHIGPNTAASSPGVTVTENGAAPDTITVTIPHGNAARLFVRMKATITP